MGNLNGTLAENSLALLRSIHEAQTLETLIAKIHERLLGPLYLCDANGTVLAIAPEQWLDWPQWADMVRTRRVSPPWSGERLGACMADPKDCVRLALPLDMDASEHPGALCVFATGRNFAPEERAFAEMAARTLEVLLRNKFGMACVAQTAKVQLLIELLGYKPGLRSYFARAIAIEGLGGLDTPFRVLYVGLGEKDKPRGADLAEQIRHFLQGAWAFALEDQVVCVFNEGLVSPADFMDVLRVYLTEQGLSGCISMAFQDILSLRQMYEVTQTAYLIGSRRAPGGVLYLSQDYQLLTFLSKCQRYFPIEAYCPEGLDRLYAFDGQNDRDYVRTLSAYLDNNRNASAAAKQLFVHRNTLIERLRHIEAMLDVSLDDAEVCLYLQISLRIRTLVNL